MKVYKGISKINIPDLMELDVEELKYFAVLQIPEITSIIQRKSKRNYFNYTQRLSKKIDYSLFERVEQLIQDKFLELIGDYFQTCNTVEKV